MSFTLEQIADAIEKNGFAQVKGDYSKQINSNTVGFCAIGMGAYNLQTSGPFLEGVLDKLGEVPNDTNDYFSSWDDKTYVGLGVYIVYLNDGREWTFKQIADWLREFAKTQETANV